MLFEVTNRCSDIPREHAYVYTIITANGSRMTRDLCQKEAVALSAQRGYIRGIVTVLSAGTILSLKYGRFETLPSPLNLVARGHTCWGGVPPR